MLKIFSLDTLLLQLVHLKYYINSTKLFPIYQEGIIVSSP